MGTTSTIRTVITASTGVVLSGALLQGAVAWAGDHDTPTARPAEVTLRTGPVVADLYPGTTEGDLVIEVDNPRTTAIRLTSLVATSVESGDETGCPPGVVSVEIGPETEYLVGPGTSRLHLVDVVAMAPTAPDGCQGVTFDVGLGATVHPAAG